MCNFRFFSLFFRFLKLKSNRKYFRFYKNFCVTHTDAWFRLVNSLYLQPFTPPLIIPPDSLIVHTAGTWSGDVRPSNKTRNLTNLYCHTWNFSPEEVSRLTDIVHGRFMAGEKWILSNPIHTYSPEADTLIWEHIEGTHPSRRLTAAFWGGGIDAEAMQALTVPPFTLKKCYIREI